MPALSKDDLDSQLGISGTDSATRSEDWQSIHAAAPRGLRSLYAICLAGNFNRTSLAVATGARQDHSHLPRGRDRVWNDWTFRQRNRQRSAGHVRHDSNAQTTRAVAARDDLRKAHSGDGLEASVSWFIEHLDDASREPPGH